MEAQGYEIKRNILYQDNKSAILLETNGKSSSSPQTRAMNICYFFLTDQIKQGSLEVEYVPTDDMIGDFFTKPLQGKQFTKFKKLIMGNWTQLPIGAAGVCWTISNPVSVESLVSSVTDRWDSSPGKQQPTTSLFLDNFPYYSKPLHGY